MEDVYDMGPWAEVFYFFYWEVFMIAGGNGNGVIGESDGLRVTVNYPEFIVAGGEDALTQNGIGIGIGEQFEVVDNFLRLSGDLGVEYLTQSHLDQTASDIALTFRAACMFDLFGVGSTYVGPAVSTTIRLEDPVFASAFFSAGTETFLTDDLAIGTRVGWGIMNPDPETTLVDTINGLGFNLYFLILPS